MADLMRVMRVMRSLVFATVALCVSCEQGAPRSPQTSAGVATATTSPSESARGTIAPDFTARDVEGKTFRLSDHLAKEVVLLDFWSTFCEPCRAEFPHLRALYDRNKPRGLIVVGVSMDGPETVADVPAFVKRFDIDFPIVLDDDSRIASLYNPKKSMPLSVIIDRAGRIGVVREGYNPGDEGLVAADVATALGQGGTGQ
jgi:peroxiredoxin